MNIHPMLRRKIPDWRLTPIHGNNGIAWCSVLLTGNIPGNHDYQVIWLPLMHGKCDNYR
jgi:hypothetical protein